MKMAVIDTSVIVKWFLTEEDEADKAAKLLNSYIRKEIFLAVPFLVVYELGNVLKTQRQIPLERKSLFLKDFFNLELTFTPFDDHVAAKTLETSIEYDLTYYDASFLVAAEEVDAMLITADKRFYNKVKDYSQVQFLAEFEL